MKKTTVFGLIGLLLLAAGAWVIFRQPSSSDTKQAPAHLTLLNVSYDPTRELYQVFNERFIQEWRSQTGQTVAIQQSHGGSGKQTRAVLDGLAADVVTLALPYDIDVLAKNEWVSSNWRTQFPADAAPYTSTIVLVVRKGNPKGIHDWNDLVRPDVQVITPNPKTGGGARWNYLAAWEYAKRLEGGNEQKAQAFVAALYKNVPVLDTGARGSSITFAQRGLGDVLISWENEAHLLRQEQKEAVEIIYPSLSVLAQPPVAIVSRNTERKGTTALARAYVQALYSEWGQDLVGRYFYRPAVSEQAKAKYAAQFPPIHLFTVEEAFGGWSEAQKKHFTDGGTFDQIYQPKAPTKTLKTSSASQTPTN
jgi:sulfate/thiosulfate-binding protein